MKNITWTQDPKDATHCAADESERYYCTAPGASPQEVANAFTQGYDVPSDDDGAAITFAIEDAAGQTLGLFVGHPNQPARRTA